MIVVRVWWRLAGNRATIWDYHRSLLFLALSDIGPQRDEMLAGRTCRIPFDHSVAINKRLPKWRQYSSTTILAASLSLDGGMATNPVDLVDQIPRPLVARPTAEIDPQVSMFSSS